MGSGNVASHIGPALVAGGWRCTAVWSRTQAHADRLATALEADGMSDGEAFLRRVSEDRELDLLILAVTDDALAEIAGELPRRLHATALHTSGSTPMTILDRVDSYGVLYPMQTFSRERALEMSEVPLFVEWHDERAKELLYELASTMRSRSIRPLDTEERGRLHLAACFVCNFVNHLYALAADLLRESGIRLTDLEPLMRETLTKALATEDPATVQTGPAARGDERTLRRHLELLRDEAGMTEVYRLLSRSIRERTDQYKEKERYE